MAEQSFDIVIIGASFGGVAAALAAGRAGKHVALIESSSSVGGQATSQGLTRWDETDPAVTPHTYGSTKSYQILKNDIRGWYRANTRLAAGVNGATFNPGFYGGGHPFSADSNVVETVLRQLLLDAQANVSLILDRSVVSAEVSAGAVQRLTLSNGDTVRATVYIDTTDVGELLPLCNVRWVIGAEAKSDTEEPHAEAIAEPGHVQPITVSIAVENRPEGGHTIPEPADYSPALVASQDFRVNDGDIEGVLASPPGTETVFNYRQYIDHRNFADPAFATDRTTINVGSNDYQAAVIPTGDTARDAEIVEAARQVSLSYLYWLQTEAPRDDGNGQGYPNLKIRQDIFGRVDGTAPQAYIRESRRIAKPLVRVLEQHIAVPDESPLARAPMNFSDSCGIGLYGIDVHPASGPGTPWQGGINVKPFQVPLGALIPSDVTNLLVGCKNIGATHITSGAYRVHPIEWAIGEAAGTLGAYCVGQRVTPQQAHSNPSRIAALQLRLLQMGAPIFWWDDVTFDADVAVFAAANLIGARGMMADSASLHFRPGDQMSQHERDAVNSTVGRHLPWPASAMTRGRSAVWLCAELGLPSSDVVKWWE